MIAGGTGLTPMYQIIRSSLQDPKDKTELALIYANVEEDDICEYLGADREGERKRAGRAMARDPVKEDPFRTVLTRQ
jgi:NAD(P)H-flavin reductase